MVEEIGGKGPSIYIRQTVKPEMRGWGRHGYILERSKEKVELHPCDNV